MKPELNLTILLLFLLILAACTESVPAPVEAAVTIKLTDKSLQTRSQDPDEELITDINWFIFNEDGLFEESGYLSRRTVLLSGSSDIEASLLKGVEYSVYVCANMGYEINSITTLSELTSQRFYLAYPDDYASGMPMSGVWTGSVTEDGEVIEIELERMMAKVSVCMDRSSLDDDVTLNVRSIQVGNCPRSALLFGESAALSSSDVFSNGFIKTYEDADDLNIDESLGVSREVSVYMLENMQGDLLPDAQDDSDKVLSSPYSSVCSYIEIKSEYISPDYSTPAEDYLIYRFYLGESVGNFDIRRNCHYHFTVKPEGDGLSGTGWRVDISALEAVTEGTITIQPSDVIYAEVGDSLHVWADVTPSTAVVTIDEELLEVDVENGLYDYEIDEDGRGLMLWFKATGTGMVYMEAGSPVNAADGAIIFVRDP